MKKENTNRKICQVGVLTRDAEQSTRACMEDLGIGPWTIMTMNQENVTDVVMYDQNISHPFGYYCATAMIGNFQIEYMQHFDGVQAYDRSIEGHGYCMQHFKEAFTNAEIEEITKDSRKNGLQVSYAGHFITDVFVNIDTEQKLDCLVELGNFADLDITVLPDEQYRYSPADAGEQQMLQEKNKDRKIGRVTVLTKRLAQVMGNAEETMGYGPWQVSSMKDGGKNYLRALTAIGDMEMEFIEPGQGVELFEKYIDRHGCGLLGISEELSPDEMERKIQELAGKGILPALDINGRNDRSVYFDTLDRVGFVYGLFSKKE